MPSKRHSQNNNNSNWANDKSNPAYRALKGKNHVSDDRVTDKKRTEHDIIAEAVKLKKFTTSTAEDNELKTILKTPEEVAFFRKQQREDFEILISKNYKQLNNFLRYAEWEEKQGDIVRARAVFEKAIASHGINPSLWRNYAEMETRWCNSKKALELAANDPLEKSTSSSSFKLPSKAARFSPLWRVRYIYQRAVNSLPQTHDLWLKYILLEMAACEEWKVIKGSSVGEVEYYSSGSLAIQAPAVTSNGGNSSLSTGHSSTSFAAVTMGGNANHTALTVVGSSHNHPVTISDESGERVIPCSPDENARAVFERWIENAMPGPHAWELFVEFECDYTICPNKTPETVAARCRKLLSKYVTHYNVESSWLYYAKIEEQKLNNIARAIQVIDTGLKALPDPYTNYGHLFVERAHLCAKLGYWNTLSNTKNTTTTNPNNAALPTSQAESGLPDPSILGTCGKDFLENALTNAATKEISQSMFNAFSDLEMQYGPPGSAERLYITQAKLDSRARMQVDKRMIKILKENKVKDSRPDCERFALWEKLLKAHDDEHQVASGAAFRIKGKYNEDKINEAVTLSKDEDDSYYSMDDIILDATTTTESNITETDTIIKKFDTIAEEILSKPNAATVNAGKKDEALFFQKKRAAAAIGYMIEDGSKRAEKQELLRLTTGDQCTSNSLIDNIATMCNNDDDVNMAAAVAVIKSNLSDYWDTKHTLLKEAYLELSTEFMKHKRFFYYFPSQPATIVENDNQHQKELRKFEEVVEQYGRIASQYIASILRKVTGKLDAKKKELVPGTKAFELIQNEQNTLVEEAKKVYSDTLAKIPHEFVIISTLWSGAANLEASTVGGKASDPDTARKIMGAAIANCCTAAVGSIDAKFNSVGDPTKANNAVAMNQVLNSYQTKREERQREIYDAYLILERDVIQHKSRVDRNNKLRLVFEASLKRFPGDHRRWVEFATFEHSNKEYERSFQIFETCKKQLLKYFKKKNDAAEQAELLRTVGSSTTTGFTVRQKRMWAEQYKIRHKVLLNQVELLLKLKDFSKVIEVYENDIRYALGLYAQRAAREGNKEYSRGISLPLLQETNTFRRVKEMLNELKLIVMTFMVTSGGNGSNNGNDDRPRTAENGDAASEAYECMSAIYQRLLQDLKKELFRHLKFQNSEIAETLLSPLQEIYLRFVEEMTVKKASFRTNNDNKPNGNNNTISEGKVTSLATTAPLATTTRKRSRLADLAAQYA